MSTENRRLLELLRAWTDQTLKDNEEAELARMLDTNGADTAIHQHVKELLEQYPNLDLLPVIDWEKTFEAIQLKKQKEAIPMPAGNRRAWWKYAAAVLILACCTAAIYLAVQNNDADENASIVLNSETKVAAPAGNRARVILSDGREISLDSLHNGVLTAEGNTRLVKLADGGVAYQAASSEEAQQVGYHTLINPKGSKIIDVKLSDGSRVWLNAASSIRYPVAFNGASRSVSIDGEAFFDIVSNSTKPFVVEKKGMKVTVLGTSFNVSAYEDEPAVKVTLLNGAVKVSEDNESQYQPLLLKPGQQGVVSPGSVKLQTHVNIDEVLAWKKGSFYFNRTPLPVVLRQFARWYDVEVEYRMKVSDNLTLSGEMGKDLNLNEALDGLRELGVHFKIEQRKLIVMP